MKLLFRLLTLLFTLATLSANAQAPILTADAAIPGSMPGRDKSSMKKMRTSGNTLPA